MKKLFLCIGAAKTGTTWLYQNLEKNPQLFFAPEKEINYFFSRHGWFDRLTPKHRAEKRDRFETNAPGTGPRYPFYSEWYKTFAKGKVTPDWYRSLFAGAEEGAWACDFSPSTSLIPDAGWEEIAGFAEDLRLVYIMREPCDRLWSHAKFHAQYIGEIDRFADMSLDEINAFIEKASLAVDGDYGQHLTRALQVVPRNRILLIDYRRIARTPYRVLRQVERFLRVPKTERKDREQQRVNVSARLPRPEGFGDAYRDRFAAETETLIELGVDFARDWLPDDDPRKNTFGDRMGRLVGLRD